MKKHQDAVSRKQNQQAKSQKLEAKSGNIKQGQVKPDNKEQDSSKTVSKQSKTASLAKPGIFQHLDSKAALEKASSGSSDKKKKPKIKRRLFKLPHNASRDEGPSDKDIALSNLNSLEIAAIPKPPKVSEQHMPSLLFRIAMAITALSDSKLSFAAAGLYVVLCNLLSRFIVVRVATAYGSYNVEVNVSGLIVGEPSTNKSAVIHRVLERGRDLISQAKKQGTEKTLFDIEKEKIQRKGARKKLEQAQKIRTEDPKQAMELEAEARSALTQAENTVRCENFIINKCTLASLVRKVSQTDDPLLMVHEEAGGLLKLTQKAGDPTKEFYIGLMDGNSTENYENAHHEFDTSGKRLSILGAVQPEVVSKIVISVNDGLIQRFPIIAYENTTSEQKITLNTSQVEKSFDTWNKLLTKLTKHPEKRYEIELTKAVQQELRLLKSHFDTRINDKQTHTILKGLFGKRPSFIVSIAAANAFIRNRGFKALVIELEDIKLAAEYAELNEEHFKIAFGFNEHTREKRALDLINRIMFSKFAKEKFTASQIAKNEWRGFKTSSSFEELLNILKKYQLAYQLKPAATKDGGRPTVYWEINKDLLEN
jgi:hypothetical protein